MKSRFCAVVTLLALILPPWVSADSGGLRSDSSDVTTAFRAALSAAARAGGRLQLDSGVYLLTDSVLVPHGVTLEGSEAKLQFHIGGHRKALVLSDNSIVRNLTVCVDSSASIVGSGAYGSPIVIGSDLTGVGARNVIVENVTVSTQRGNGIVVLGGSENVTLRNIHILSSRSISVGILCEWGNTSFSIAQGADSGHVRHPHNITISNVVIDTLSMTGNMGICLSGAYNVVIENVVMYSVGEGLRIGIGDPGFRYSDRVYEDTSWMSMYGVTITNAIVKRSSVTGLWIYGKSQLFSKANVKNIPEEEKTWVIPVTVINSAFSGDSNMAAGVLLTNAESVRLDNCMIRNYFYGVDCGTNTRFIRLRDCTITHNRRSGVWINDEAAPPEGISISGCTILGNGLELGASNSCGVYVGSARGTAITDCTIGLQGHEHTVYGISVSSKAVRTTLFGNYVADLADSPNATPYLLAPGESIVTLFQGNTARAGLKQIQTK